MMKVALGTWSNCGLDGVLNETLSSLEILLPESVGKYTLEVPV